MQYAIATKFRDGSRKPRENLLDYSIDKYGHELVNDTRILLKILMLYLPLPFFWALFDQQGSRWTFQADKMNGDIGFYVIKPDQMQLVNPLLILIFIPLFDVILYPLLSKIGIRRSLQKLTLGGILAGVAFVSSALVQFHIDASPEKSVSILWLVPQYVIITLAEVMFSVTGLSFSYEQAPESMKSVVQAFWLLTVAFGNLILVFVAEFAFFESQAYEFLLFAGLMFIDMMIFMILARNFKSTPRVELAAAEEDETSQQNVSLESFEGKRPI